MGHNGTMDLLKIKCSEPCDGSGGTSGGVNYQPQIDEINNHLNQNDGKLTTLEVEQANIKNTYASKTYVNDGINNVQTQVDDINEHITNEINRVDNKIDNIQHPQGIDYQPQIDELKNINNQQTQIIQTLQNEINVLKQNIGKTLKYKEFNTRSLNIQKYKNNVTQTSCYSYTMELPTIDGIKVSKNNLVNLSFDTSWYNNISWGWFGDKIFIYMLSNNADNNPDNHMNFTAQFTIFA